MICKILNLFFLLSRLLKKLDHDQHSTFKVLCWAELGHLSDPEKGPGKKINFLPQNAGFHEEKKRIKEDL